MKIKRWFLAVSVLLVFIALPAYASDISVTIEGQPVVFADQQPANVDGRTLVPVRGVFEALGFDVDWEEETGTAVLSNDSHVIRITIGSNIFTTNSVSRVLDVPAQSIGGRTMIPVRAVLESAGFFVEWDAASQTVLITTQESPTAPFTLTIWVEQDTLPQGEDFRVHVELRNNTDEDYEIAYDFLFWPRIDDWHYLEELDIAIDWPMIEPQVILRANDTLRNTGLFRRGSSDEPWTLGNSLEAGTHELHFSASFHINLGQDDERSFNLRSNTVTLTVQ